MLSETYHVFIQSRCLFYSNHPLSKALLLILSSVHWFGPDNAMEIYALKPQSKEKESVKTQPRKVNNKNFMGLYKAATSRKLLHIIA